MQIFLMVLVVAAYSSGVASAPEKELVKYLIDQYARVGIEGRPVQMINETVEVKIRLALESIINVDSSTGTFAFLMSMRWHDPFLNWQASDYSHINAINLPVKAIWRPDVVHWFDTRSSTKNQNEEMEAFEVLAMSNGDVIWVPRVRVQTKCRDHDQNGRFNCTFVIGSWLHHDKQLDFSFLQNKAEIDLTYYDSTPGFEIVENKAKKESHTFPCCPNAPYAMMSYNLIIRKWPMTKTCMVN